MIVLGYSGIGRTTLCEQHPGFKYVDLDSWPFRADRSDVSLWVKTYVMVATRLSAQGYIVFLDALEPVCDALVNSTEVVLLICPSLELESQWVKKLESRYHDSRSYDDYHAWIDADKNYEAQITKLLEYENMVACIDSMDYDLSRIIREFLSMYAQYENLGILNVINKVGGQT
jgi:hypothetical protein